MASKVVEPQRLDLAVEPFVDSLNGADNLDNYGQLGKLRKADSSFQENKLITN